MSAPLTFKKVMTPDDLKEIHEFGETFDHPITDQAITPIVGVYRGRKLVAYFCVLNQPIVTPSFHTDRSICSTRDFKEICEHLRSWAWLNSLGDQRNPRGVFWVAIPDNLEPARKMIGKSMGFEDTGQHLYCARP